MRFKGKIAEWNDPRGFGFITPLEGRDRVFVHISAFPTESRRPDVGEFVSYELRHDEQGRPQALNVTYVVSRSTRRGEERAASLAKTVSGMVAVTFLGGVALAAVIEMLPWWVPGAYIMASIAAYVAYKADKKAAGLGTWRTAEAHLLLVGLFGGWPGALFAQHDLRHKNRKASFQVQYWSTVALNLGLLVWLRA